MSKNNGKTGNLPLAIYIEWERTGKMDVKNGNTSCYRYITGKYLAINHKERYDDFIDEIKQKYETSSQAS